MLSALRKSDGKTVLAYFESKANAPFLCPDCGDEVALRSGRNRVDHFAHVDPLACLHALNETDEHRRCKMEIFQALKREPSVEDVVLERHLETVRPDISAFVRGVPVAIEVQISSLSLETITHRTIQYYRKGIHVLWLLPWTAELEVNRYSPHLWEKWIHAAYFGRVYYWKSGLTVASYHFEPSLKSIRQTSWYSKDGKKMTGGGYSKRLKRHRTAIHRGTFNLVKDFAPKERNWWEGNGLTVPAAKLFMER